MRIESAGLWVVMVAFMGGAAAGTPALALAEDTAPAACTARSVQIDQKSSLPPGVLSALGFDLAERGAPYRADGTPASRQLPARRFISARQQGCSMSLTYETGSEMNDNAVLRLVDGRWQLVSRTR